MIKYNNITSNASNDISTTYIPNINTKEIYVHHNALRYNTFGNKSIPNGVGLNLTDYILKLVSGSSSPVTWTSVTGKPNFHSVATSGDYNDLINKPIITDTHIGNTNLSLTSNRTLDIGANEFLVRGTGNSKLGVGPAYAAFNFIGSNDGMGVINGNTVILQALDAGKEIQLVSPTIKFLDGTGVDNTGKYLQILNNTGQVTFVDKTAAQTPSSPITATTTNISVPSSNVQGAISDLSTAVKTVETTASNGVSKNGKNFELGRIIGSTDNSSAFTNSRELNLNGRSFNFAGSGRIGINNPNPLALFDIQAPSGTIPLIVQQNASWTSTPSFMVVGTAANGYIGQLGCSQNSFDISANTGSNINIFGNGWTNRTGITISGLANNVGIGTTVPTAKLQVVGNQITTGSMTAANYITSSDKNIKDNIAPVKSGLDVINKLNPVSYNIKDEYNTDEIKNKKYGFIAQEVQEILPEIIRRGKIYNQRNREQYKIEENDCNEKIQKIQKRKKEKLDDLKKLDPLYDKKFKDGTQDNLLDIFDKEIKTERDKLEKRKYLLDDDDILQIHNQNESVIAHLVKAVQEQQAQIEALRKIIGE